MPLREIGSEPDPRFTFANERTFLAWNRTSLALIAAGLAVAQFLDLPSKGVTLLIALPLIALGGATAFASYRRWDRSERCLRLGEPLPYSRLQEGLSYGVAVVAFMAAILMVFDLLVLR